MLHAIQISTMSSSSAHSSPSDTLQQLENKIKEHEDTLPHLKDILSKPEDIFAQPEDALPPHALPLHEDILPQPKDTLYLPPPENVLPLRKDTLPRLADILSQPEDSIMLSGRSEGRNVHIFDLSDPNTTIGGLILTNGVTNANLYAMVEILVIFESEFTLQSEGGITVARDGNLLQPGNYYIHAAGKFLNNNSFIYR
jgi:hypothetical protein